MKIINIYLILIVLVFFSCTKKSYLDIDASKIEQKDKCFNINDEKGVSISVNRKIKIIENTLTDTISMGYAIVYPGETGDFTNYRFKENGMLDPEASSLPLMKEICVHKYMNKVVKGKLKLEFSY